MTSVKSTDAKSARKCNANLWEAFKRWSVWRLKKKKSLDKQFGNCAVSLKVPKSAVLGLDEKSPYSKVEVKPSKHSHDALWSKKKKEKRNLDYKDNSSSQ